MSLTRKETCLREAACARVCASCTALELVSTPITWPSSPTNSAASKLTSPGPQPTSSTFIPLLIPTSSNNRRVNGLSSWPCVSNRWTAWISCPKAYVPSTDAISDMFFPSSSVWVPPSRDGLVCVSEERNHLAREELWCGIDGCMLLSSHDTHLALW